MAIPFEAFLPYAIMFGMFGATGLGLSAVRTYRNDGKRHRWSLDHWDKAILEVFPDYTKFNINAGLVMERDRRLTGSMRGQTDNAVAPAGFELSSAWKLEKRIY
ncbi:hypothetical protein DFP73DRAFT_528593 [Morchella snyderi]|nr:hypothetical protein DFP73DRAFT_528593 [Morchella snyderi]